MDGQLAYGFCILGTPRGTAPLVELHLEDFWFLPSPMEALQMVLRLSTLLLEQKKKKMLPLAPLEKKMKKLQRQTPLSR